MFKFKKIIKRLKIRRNKILVDHFDGLVLQGGKSNQKEPLHMITNMKKTQKNIILMQFVFVIMVGVLTSGFIGLLLGGENFAPVKAGATGDFEFELDDWGWQAIITGYNGTNTDVVIPSWVGDDWADVSDIGESAFANNDLTSVEIPERVTSIGAQAFANNNLTSVEILCSGMFIGSSQLGSIGESAFANNDLTSLEIPDSVTSIGAQAFANNDLTTVIMPADVNLGVGQGLDFESFYDAGGKQAGTYTYDGSEWQFEPRPTFEFEDGTIIRYNGLDTDVVIPSKIEGQAVKSIGDEAFHDKDLTSVVIPNSVTSIGKRAFARNPLTSVLIPDSVTSIGEYALSYTDLTSLEIPDSVTSIGAYALSYNYNLTSLVIPDSVESVGQQGATYNRNLTSLVIGNDINIGDNAFNHSTNLKSVEIGDNVNLGRFAFRNTNLISVNIGDNVDISLWYLTMGVNGEGFKEYYDQHGAGVYTYDGENWQFQQYTDIMLQRIQRLENMLARTQQSILDLEENIDKRNSEIMMRTQISEQEKAERRSRNLDERIFIAGRNLEYDVAPFIREGRTLVPVRAITEGLGADVSWSAEEKKVTITRDEKVIELFIGKVEVLVDGKEETIDVPAEIVDNRTFVPIRFISEILKEEVLFDEQTGEIDILLDISEEIKFVHFKN